MGKSFSEKDKSYSMATPIVEAVIKNPVIMVSDGDGDDDID